MTDDGAAYARLTYEELVDALEEMTRRMASGDIGIEEAAALYAEAGGLHAAAVERLDRVQQSIETLKATTTEQ